MIQFCTSTRDHVFEDMPSRDDTSRGTGETDPSDLGLVGDVIGDRYRIERHLASGAHGDVLAAFDDHDERDVAIKLLSPEARANHPRAIARMRQEAEILKVLEHPNLVRVYDIDSSEQGTFLVMELLEGRTLGQVIEHEGATSGERIQPIAHHLLDALDAMHDHGVHHRDVKPDNVLLTNPEGDEASERAKLVDLGIAQADESFEPDRDVTLVETQGDAFLGTPRYASPEQAVGDPIGPSTDLFSLGLVLAEWFRGEPLIDASERRGALSVLVHPKPFDLSGCPEAWQPWLRRMVAKAPDDRFESAREALEQLPEVSRADEPATHSNAGDSDEEESEPDRTREIPEEELSDLVADSESSSHPSDATLDVGLNEATVPLDSDRAPDLAPDSVDASAEHDAVDEREASDDSDLSSTLEAEMSLDDAETLSDASEPTEAELSLDEAETLSDASVPTEEEELDDATPRTDVDASAPALDARAEPPADLEASSDRPPPSDEFLSPRTPRPADSLVHASSSARSAPRSRETDDDPSVEPVHQVSDTETTRSERAREAPPKHLPASESDDDLELLGASRAIGPLSTDAPTSSDDERLASDTSSPSTPDDADEIAETESPRTSDSAPEPSSNAPSSSSGDSSREDASDVAPPSRQPSALMGPADVLDDRGEHGKMAASVLFLMFSIAVFLWTLGWL
jgi:serine/threonine protein kinase